MTDQRTAFAILAFVLALVLGAGFAVYWHGGEFLGVAAWVVTVVLAISAWAKWGVGSR